MTILGLASFAAGSLSAAAVFAVENHLKTQEVQKLAMAEMMYADPYQPYPPVAQVQSLNADSIAVPAPNAETKPQQPNPIIETIKAPFSGLIKQDKYYLTFKKSGKVIGNTYDPIWTLAVMQGNKVLYEFEAVSGRAEKQIANRHISGNKSPLPVGTYYIAASATERGPFDDPELGNGYWIPIFPKFATGRSHLGFHHDPSWGIKNGESGTSGCVGLKTAQDTQLLVNWINKYNIKSLVVES